MRINNVFILEAENEGTETINEQYYSNGTQLYTTLPNLNSSVTYEIEITNSSEDLYEVTDIIELINLNKNMKYEIRGHRYFAINDTGLKNV